MGGNQAASTLLDITVSALKRQGKVPDAEELEALRQKVKDAYDAKTDIRYAASRLWIDAILDPGQTREVLIEALQVATRVDEGKVFKTGVLQV
jgi:acetyl-CoA carboxylase carboxyltransferase component